MPEALIPLTGEATTGRCLCGNEFLPDEIFCRRCGAPRPQTGQAPAPEPVWPVIDVASSVRQAAPPRKLDDRTIPRAEMSRLRPVLEDQDADPTSARKSGSPRKSAGSQELWKAIQGGDSATVQRLVEQGVCFAGMRDASGHSVLWHLIAWGHSALALFILDRFPFGADGAADVGDVHPTRGDTLLHLVCRAAPFGPEAAEVFKRVARKAGAGTLLVHRNRNGETFLDVAACALNFWAVKFTARNFPAQMKAFVCASQSSDVSPQSRRDPPLRSLARRVAKPQIPAPPATTTRHPQHLDLAQMLRADTAGMVPHADVAFDVGPSASQRPPLVQAHRVIVGSRSAVLLEEFKRQPPRPLSQLGGLEACLIRIDSRISREVFLCALHFMYSGEARCSFARDAQKTLELLHLCMLYHLPRPLFGVACASLCALLPTASPREAKDVFSMVSSFSGMASVAGTEHKLIVESSAYWFLRGAHEACIDMVASDMSKLLERALDALEASVFR